MLFLDKRKIILALCFFAFFALCGWFWRHRESVPFISQPLSIAAAPFQYGAGKIAKIGATGIGIIDQNLSKWQELDALKKENEGLKTEQVKYSEILAENIRLRELLKFRQGYTQFNLLGASVIAKDYGTWTNTITVDRGSQDGIKKYMPVIVPAGLVGFVSEVYLTSSRVQTLIDPRTTVGGIVQRPLSRVASMVSGNSGSPDILSFTNISREADVVKGDLIITSGYGGVYPPGLTIGTVERVRDDADGISEDADIKPSANFARLEEVFIITDQIQKTSPEDLNTQVLLKEPPMNPNVKQAGGTQ